LPTGAASSEKSRRSLYDTGTKMMPTCLFLALLSLLVRFQLIGCFSIPQDRLGVERTRKSALSSSGDSAYYGNNNDDDDDEHGAHSAMSQQLQPVTPCVIKCIGVGGGGGNAINHMIQSKVPGVSFTAVNTDAQALSKSLASNIVNIGRLYTRGLGAGGDPAIGARAALESMKELEELCQDADMVFITAGLGGGTGSGAAPVLAEIAKVDCGCLTVAVVTKPFAFEGRRRMKQANDAMEQLRKTVDTLIVVSNDKLLKIVPENTPITDAFLVADDILRQAIAGISEIIINPGLVNVDFADVKAVMKDAGLALIGIGTGSGKNRASDAAIAAISSPLLDFPIRRAKRVVFNICGGEDLGLNEINAASEVIYANCDEDANIIFGALVDPSRGEEVSITVLACDFDEDSNEILQPMRIPKEETNIKKITDVVPPQVLTHLHAEHHSDSSSVTRKRGFKRPPPPPAKSN
jgi:cell division protein FtsZ